MYIYLEMYVCFEYILASQNSQLKGCSVDCGLGLGLYTLSALLCATSYCVYDLRWQQTTHNHRPIKWPLNAANTHVNPRR